jgi:transposase
MKLFLRRVFLHLAVGLAIIAISLGMGMVGYHHFEQMSWIDAYENAAMILSGMGPVSEIRTEDGKLFAGTYALFSGIVFLVVIAIIVAPLFHRFFHKFLIEEPL